MENDKQGFVMTSAFLPWTIKKELGPWEAANLIAGKLPDQSNSWVDVNAWEELLLEAIEKNEIEQRDEKIPVSDLREWLKNKGVFPGFFFPAQQNNRDNGPAPLSQLPAKREGTLLKVIGALLTMKYQDQSYFKGNGEVNADHMARQFNIDLAEAGFTDDGLKSDTIRKTVLKQAFEAIAENRRE